jgi:uncharacterized membrane protein (DUF4010 family)
VLRNPFDFWMAVRFGLVLAAVIVLAQALEQWAGHAGVYLVAAVSGFVDVDAATLTLARMTPSQVPVEVGVGGVLLACVTNTAFKAAIAVFNSKGALLKPMVVGVGVQLIGLVAGAVLAWALFVGSG